MDWDAIPSNKEPIPDVSLTKRELIKRQYTIQVVSGAVTVTLQAEKKLTKEFGS